MSTPRRIELSLEQLSERVAALPPPRADDVSRPLAHGESLADRLFTMCGLDAPSAAELESNRKAREH